MFTRFLFVGVHVNTLFSKVAPSGKSVFTTTVTASPSWSNVFTFSMPVSPTVTLNTASTVMLGLALAENSVELLAAI